MLWLRMCLDLSRALDADILGSKKNIMTCWQAIRCRFGYRAIRIKRLRFPKLEQEWYHSELWESQSLYSDRSVPKPAPDCLPAGHYIFLRSQNIRVHRA